jgi:CheY-like chemotaxis protein
MSDSNIDILLVQDNLSDVEVALRALSGQNLCERVQVARDGEEALDFLFCQGKFASRHIDQLPRVILLDLNLPLVDGLEVLQQVRADARTRYVPVVILSASAGERDVANSYAHGANSYITKPMDYELFTDAMRTIATYWLLNRPPAKVQT